MKKIFLNLLIIAAVSISAVGSSVAYFSDQEKSQNNIFTAGVIEISVNDETHWAQEFNWENARPGELFEIILVITNNGGNPVKIWKAITNVQTAENEITPPEQHWYDENNNGEEKNDLDTAIIYEMLIDNYLAVSSEAKMKMSQIKDHYINLMSLDPIANFELDGILKPGESITVAQKYLVNEQAGNWAQSDTLSFDIEILARQVDAPEPQNLALFLDNKYSSGTWAPTPDVIAGLLKYNYQSPEFNYDFFASALDPAKEYCLIYYADGWPGSNPGALIASGFPESSGNLLLASSTDLGFSLPHPDDANYPYGAKIWLVPCDQYNKNSKSIIGWSPSNDDWLFETWPGLINYVRGESPATENSVETVIVQIDEPGSDIDSQYGYWHDYSPANVTFTFQNPMPEKIIGTIAGAGLKPYQTYQVKLVGIPTCADAANGNDTANEYIGYKGRWSCIDCNGDPSANNRTDAQYEANKLLPDVDKECIVGYLVFDYFTADAAGNIVAQDAAIQSDTSYHVLWCGGGACASNTNDGNLAALDSDHPGVLFCPADKVNGEPEPGRGGCNGLLMDAGNYFATMVLTEESFHVSGNWASVLQKNISFEID